MPPDPPIAPLSVPISVPISVIVPTRDTRALTLRCLAALRVSTVRPAEIIVVDDGGGDGTGEAVKAAYPDVRVVTHARAGGFTVSVNDAWPLATGAIVLLLNSDAEVGPEAIARFADAFARDRTLGIAGASLRHPDGRPQWSAGRAPTAAWLWAMASGSARALGRLSAWRWLRRESQAQGDGEAFWVPATAMAVRRDVFDAIGGFDPAFAMYAQDLDYCVRARAAGWRIVQLRDAFVVHALGATIGRTAGAVATGQDPRALVVDLSRWIRKAHAEGEALRLCRALDRGLGARIAARRAARWFVRGADRARWDRDTDRYVDARTALREDMRRRCSIASR